MRITVILSCLIMCLYTNLFAQSNELNSKLWLNNDWIITPTSNVNSTTFELSNKDSDTYSIEIPSTVFNGLRQNGLYKDVLSGQNLLDVETAQFKQDWWYIKHFELEELDKNAVYKMGFDGINYKAEIYLNGKKLEASRPIEGPFGMWEFDVSTSLKKGDNTLAVKVSPPKDGDLTIGFVDWNPEAPDKNMGLWRGVWLQELPNTFIKDVFVYSTFENNDYSNANLHIDFDLVNESNKKTTVVVQSELFNQTIQKSYEIEANSNISVKWSASSFKELSIKNPELWWPNNLGNATMHEMKLTLSNHSNVKLMSLTQSFGIREIQQYFTKEGYRGYKVNGKKVLIRGAGWVDDIFLADTDEKVVTQMEYAKHMNLNTIRLEGFWGRNKTLYETADRLGLLLMIGWSCQWEWTAYCQRPETSFMCITDPTELQHKSDAYAEQVKWLRNHPSVFLWVFGSDKLPLPELENMLNEKITAIDPSRPILPNCKDRELGTDDYIRSEISGAIGVKMLGPYAYVSPNYWYLDTKGGGAYGFNTETGPGPQVPPLESTLKMLGEGEKWPPINKNWDYHAGRHEFRSLNRWFGTFQKRYGQMDSIEEFTEWSQVSNYEAMRPMFEAFSVNKEHATGVVQWMFNSAWPETFWQFFDYYLRPNGAYYAARKANEPVHAIYDYKEHAVVLSNDLFEKVDVDLKITGYNKDSEVLFEQTKNHTIAAVKAKTVIDLKEHPFPDFLEIEYTYDGISSKNWYWLSKKQDKPDFENAKWFMTPLLEVADYTWLQKLEVVDLDAKIVSVKGNELEVVLTNTADKIAFFTDVQLVSKEDQSDVLNKVLWSDNYITIAPNESVHIKAECLSDEVNLADKKLRIKAINGNTIYKEVK